MTFDYEITLVEQTYTIDGSGYNIPNEARTDVLCDVQSVTRSEHYSAAAYGLKPEIVFVVNKFEYEGQKEVEFNGSRYMINRTFAPKKSKGISDFETIELICSGLVNGVV